MKSGEVGYFVIDKRPAAEKLKRPCTPFAVIPWKPHTMENGNLVVEVKFVAGHSGIVLEVMPDDPRFRDDEDIGVIDFPSGLRLVSVDHTSPTDPMADAAFDMVFDGDVTPSSPVADMHQSIYAVCMGAYPS